MGTDLRAIVDERAEGYRRRFVAMQRAAWEAYVSGSEQALDEQASTEQAWIEFLSDPAAFERLKNWEPGAADDRLLGRQLSLLQRESERYQMDPDAIRQITELNQKLNQTFLTFRSELDGRPATDNEVKEVLRLDTDSERRRTAWEASKQIGPQVAGTVRQLARIRNRAAQAMGYRDYRAMSLTLAEIDEAELEAVVEGLLQSTQSACDQVKGELDARLADRFHVRPEELRPWHYADPFFQEAPQVEATDLDPLFESADPMAYPLRTFDPLGMDVRDILERSDLFERQGKYQHAACFGIDREGDVRVIANLRGDYDSATTMLHELGHGVFSKYAGPQLPWLLRRYNHTLTTEAMAILCGRFTSNDRWLVEVLGLEPAAVEAMLPGVKAHRRLEQLVLMRWMSVVIEFERALYRDPEQDLDTVWWDLVERHQQLSRPEGRHAPDWAAKIHIALYPIYYQNYLLGELMSHQWESWLLSRFGSVVGNCEAGNWLREQVIEPGDREDWNSALERATGERLNPAHFAARLRPGLPPV